MTSNDAPASGAPAGRRRALGKGPGAAPEPEAQVAVAEPEPEPETVVAEPVPEAVVEESVAAVGESGAAEEVDDGVFKVRLVNFEGPFDLLLQLISKHKDRKSVV